jgi:hypothetical protein
MSDNPRKWCTGAPDCDMCEIEALKSRAEAAEAQLDEHKRAWVLRAWSLHGELREAQQRAEAAEAKLTKLCQYVTEESDADYDDAMDAIRKMHNDAITQETTVKLLIDAQQRAEQVEGRVFVLEVHERTIRMHLDARDGEHAIDAAARAASEREEARNGREHFKQLFEEVCAHVAEACQYLGSDPRESPPDSWTLRERAIRMARTAMDMRAELDEAIRLRESDSKSLAWTWGEVRKIAAALGLDGKATVPDIVRRAAALREQSDALTWHTTCLNCSRLLSQCSVMEEVVDAAKAACVHIGCAGDDEMGCTRDDDNIPRNKWCCMCLLSDTLSRLDALKGGG